MSVLAKGWPQRKIKENLSNQPHHISPAVHGGWIDKSIRLEKSLLYFQDVVETTRAPKRPTFLLWVLHKQTGEKYTCSQACMEHTSVPNFRSHSFLKSITHYRSSSGSGIHHSSTHARVFCSPTSIIKSPLLQSSMLL